MKSEHRHELAENDLSKALGRVLQKAEPYSNKILLATLVITVVVVAIVYGMKSATGNRSAGFAELTDCETGDCLETVADQYPDSEVGTWARLRAGELYLTDGIRMCTTDGNMSRDSLHKARDAFEKVLKGENVPPSARERALYGLGTSLEALSDANTRPAIEAYQSLLDEFKDSQYRFLVEDRINALKTNQAQEFYAWFHKQTPKPEDLPPRDPLDFLKHTLPGTPPEKEAGTPAGDNAGDSGLPPPPPSAEPHTDAPTPPAEAAGEGGPSLPEKTPAATPETTPDTPPDGEPKGGEAPTTPPQGSESADKPAGESTP